MALTGAKALMAWCQQITNGYKDVKVTNMTSSWRDGLAFCAILHHYRPDLINFDKLSKENIAENNHLAFTVAENELDIAALLDVEDMVAMAVPDKLSIMTYVSQYYNYFKDKVPGDILPPSRHPSKRHAAFTTNDIPKKKTPVPGVSAAKEVIGASPEPKMNKGTIDRFCARCRETVYLMERLKVEGRLFHRVCFKCFTCDAQLRLGSYRYIPAEDQFYCDKHYRKRTTSTSSDESRSPQRTQQNEQDALHSLLKSLENKRKANKASQESLASASIGSASLHTRVENARKKFQQAEKMETDDDVTNKSENIKQKHADKDPPRKPPSRPSTAPFLVNKDAYKDEKSVLSNVLKKSTDLKPNVTKSTEHIPPRPVNPPVNKLHSSSDDVSNKGGDKDGKTKAVPPSRPLHSPGDRQVNKAVGENSDQAKKGDARQFLANVLHKKHEEQEHPAHSGLVNVAEKGGTNIYEAPFQINPRDDGEKAEFENPRYGQKLEMKPQAIYQNEGSSLLSLERSNLKTDEKIEDDGHESADDLGRPKSDSVLSSSSEGGKKKKLVLKVKKKKKKEEERDSVCFDEKNEERISDRVGKVEEKEIIDNDLSKMADENERMNEEASLRGDKGLRDDNSKDVDLKEATNKDRIEKNHDESNGITREFDKNEKEDLVIEGDNKTNDLEEEEVDKESEMNSRGKDKKEDETENQDVKLEGIEKTEKLETSENESSSEVVIGNDRIEENEDINERMNERRNEDVNMKELEKDEFIENQDDNKEEKKELKVLKYVNPFDDTDDEMLDEDNKQNEKSKVALNPFETSDDDLDYDDERMETLQQPIDNATQDSQNLFGGPIRIRPGTGPKLLVSSQKAREHEKKISDLKKTMMEKGIKSGQYKNPFLDSDDDLLDETKDKDASHETDTKHQKKLVLKVKKHKRRAPQPCPERDKEVTESKTESDDKKADTEFKVESDDRKTLAEYTAESDYKKNARISEVESDDKKTSTESIGEYDDKNTVTESIHEPFDKKLLNPPEQKSGGNLQEDRLETFKAYVGNSEIELNHDKRLDERPAELKLEKNRNDRNSESGMVSPVSASCPSLTTDESNKNSNIDQPSLDDAINNLKVCANDLIEFRKSRDNKLMKVHRSDDFKKKTDQKDVPPKRPAPPIPKGVQPYREPIGVKTTPPGAQKELRGVKPTPIEAQKGPKGTKPSHIGGPKDPSGMRTSLAEAPKSSANQKLVSAEQKASAQTDKKKVEQKKSKDKKKDLVDEKKKSKEKVLKVKKKDKNKSPKNKKKSEDNERVIENIEEKKDIEKSEIYIVDEKELTLDEIAAELKTIESSQRGLEMRGVKMEKKLREQLHGEPEENYMITWFDLVTEKNKLLRRENELIYMSQEIEYHNNQKRIEYELRLLMEKDESMKTEEDRQAEEQLLAQLVNYVSRRNKIVEKMEEDRLREKEEDEQIQMVMRAQGLSKHKKKKAAKKNSSSATFYD